MNLLQRIFLFGVLVSSVLSLPLQSVQALTDCPDPRTTLQSGVCVPTASETGLSDQGVDAILMSFLNWLLLILGTLALIAFVISGLQYLFAAGDDKMVETAKRNMTWSIVGVIIALSSYIILQAIFMALNASPIF